MAVELCSESWSWSAAPATSANASPRISFSRDLSQSDVAPASEQRSGSSLILGSPPPDFDFCVSRERSDLEPCSADELFYDGKLLPLPIQAKNPIPNQIPIRGHVPLAPPPPPRLSSAGVDRRKESLKEIIACPSDDGSSDEKTQFPSKSFWPFRRSSSLNCGSPHKPSLICSLPLLYRSKSTGSNPNPYPIPKQRQSNAAKSNGTTTKKTTSFRKAPASASSKTASYYYSGSKKGSYGYGNGVRINHVLNVPHHYIPKGSISVGFFSFGHLLCNGKDKNRKKSLFPHSL